MNPFILNDVSKQNYFQATPICSYWETIPKTFRNVIHFRQLKTKEKLLFFNEVFRENLRRINNEEHKLFVPIHFFLKVSWNQANLSLGSRANTSLAPF